MTRRPRDGNVTRVPPLLPNVLALAEHPTGDPVDVNDLAVTADGDQMYLVQISTGCRVAPHIPHALDTTVQSPPLARFLAEVADARTAVFGPFDVGAARTLPYLPRIRYRRTVLAPARWILTAEDLPTRPGDRWEAEFKAWRDRWRVPAWVVLCSGDLRLPLDLDHRLDSALLHTRLARARRLELQEHAHTDEQDWVGRPVELLIPMTTTTPVPRRLPPLASPGVPLSPGGSVMLHARLAGNPARFDEIIATHLPRLAASLGPTVQRWWLRRHRDMIRLDADQHLALVLRLTDPAHHASAAARLSAFAADLATRGLPAQLSLVPYRPHPGRFGHGPALAAAEQVFAADTTCAIAQIAAAEHNGTPAQALAAASMARIAAGFATDPVSGLRALLDRLPQQTGPLDPVLRDHTLRLTQLSSPDRPADPDALADAWRRRDGALTTYHRALAGQRDPADVLPTLLHDHHLRALGADPTFEKITNRLARAAALRDLHRAGTA